MILYNEETHREVLKILIKNQRPRTQCPVRIFQKQNRVNYDKLIIICDNSSICKICREFVGLTQDDMCPCTHLGEREAIRRTKKGLKNYV